MLPPRRPQRLAAVERASASEVAGAALPVERWTGVAEQDEDRGMTDAATDILDPADRDRLAALVEGATARQSEALDDAIDGGLGHIPRFLRGPVRAVLFR